MTNFEPEYPQRSGPSTAGGPPAYGRPPFAQHQPGQQDGQPQYAQQHGPPPTGQPGYGQGQYAPAWGPPRAPTNTMAILALVFAFVFAPLGIVFGVIARGQIARTREEGGSLALAGIVVGSVFTVLIILYFIVLFVLLGSAVDQINHIDFPTAT